MKEIIDNLKIEFDNLLQNAGENYEELKVSFLGKKGKVTELMQNLRDIPGEQRRDAGIAINNFKQYVEAKLEEHAKKIEAQKLEREINSAERIDITVPTAEKVGSLHPITVVQKEVEEVFKSMGFMVEDGNEVETEFNNFDAVNVPRNHPARDMQDTF